MEITVKSYETSVSVNLPDDCNITDLLKSFIGICLIDTFSISTIKKGLENTLEEF